MKFVPGGGFHRTSWREIATTEYMANGELLAFFAVVQFFPQKTHSVECTSSLYSEGWC